MGRSVAYHSPIIPVRNQFYFRFSAAVQKVAVLFAGSTSSREASREAVNREAEQILTVYGNSMLRFAYSYLHNMSDAEDVLQETMVRFLKAAPAFASEQHRKAWLLRVVGNLSKNRLAYNKIRMADELRDELIAENRDDLSFVWDAVKALPGDLRETIHLFYYEGYSTKQIADILQKKEATVRTHLRRGREKLREILKGEYDFEDKIR